MKMPKNWHQLGIYDQVQQSIHGDATLNVCKWVGDLDGQRCCFGVSFIIDE
jgi:hypothetical protein